ncbi:hypothetical protein CY34DRAFT_107842 [Suillus luteus UH-Slu-Lm8-n1]|uniref:Unplaced genomic scaffold CY34scaffold_177, whole genome shotgun sequence n=1 Tax=Suillus luteus UH-Slu-Lm8-n1 TaxID=930992 RepID=A0A0D0AF11_9AGAM|nr:hypothetical protein CY34DRAFT_107842 [Suillus luteus UH-Slu-Lm8-n1]
MATASMNDINDVAVPPTIEAKHLFIQLLSNSILAMKETTTSTATHAAVAITADFDVDSTKATKKNFKKNPNAVKETDGRATAKSLWAIDWVESNVGGTNAAFENYWRKLNKEGEKKYHDMVALVKTAKVCAVSASPVVTYFQQLCEQFSNAFDIYLHILWEVQSRVDGILGKDPNNWQMNGACLSCAFKYFIFEAEVDQFKDDV